MQAVQTWDAKKHLKTISGRERRFKRDVNHCISKQIVAAAKDTQSGIALEDLTGIREGVSGFKALRAAIGRAVVNQPIALCLEPKGSMRLKCKPTPLGVGS